ncbi:UbiA family prenyltransferase [Arthrobacter sp. zg-Y820]|uniref:SCO3242 family prenyltransferase n=1 Tax=unclassified Arthrobacter TaxID=235627 RepID=UPI00253FD7F6|nr:MULTISPECIES: UbiA family prenyltransferase [unclassified Arthrobacter]MCC9196906.1 UbiA family prenyltransferase [Arthrobacter sp. zg-Y820]MDK1279770.1 UbiA family prenyltransferase [Arthrobacter sp. zg.Y820]WIB10976.1 UbiA family prenyltransferase [Arthrobacter sp. zg-Y820]
MTRFGDYLELVRAPAVLTVLGDTVAGGAAAGRALSGRWMWMPLASACLYAGGMALNDYADRDVDARERPKRPIPSGRVSAGSALAAASALTVAGLGLCAAAGGRSALALGIPLAASIWTYDLIAKDHALIGALSMGSCRALDVLMGAGAGHVRPALGAAGIMGGHTVAVTLLSRGEVEGTDAVIASGAAATTGLVAAAVVAGSSGPPARMLAVLAATAAYAARCGPAQIRAARSPAASNALAATRAGIRAMIPLQAALAVRYGHPTAAGALVAVDVLGKILRSRPNGRKVSES